MIRIKRLFYALSITLPLLFLFQNCGEGFDSSEEASLTKLSKDPLSLVPPTITFNTVINSFVPQNMINIEFSGTDSFGNSVRKFDCAINGEPFSTCSSPLQLTGLEDGNYILEVKAIDLFKNETISSLVWDVDLTPPNVIINTPPSLTASQNLNINFQATDNLSNIESLTCRVNGALRTPCTSPLNFRNLSEGNYNLIITAFDNAGHEFVSNLVSWTISNAAPVLGFSTKPEPFTKLKQATFTMTEGPVVDGLRSRQCRINGGAFTNCANPISFSNLPEGPNFFEFRVVNGLGVPSMPIRYNWIIDTVNPVVRFTSAPTAQTLKNFASFTFNVTEEGSGVLRSECSLNSQEFTTCTSPRNFSGLAVGNHNIRIRTLDRALNQRTVTYSWSRRAEANCIGVGPCINSPKSLVSNASGQKLYSINYENSTIIEIDVLTGNRRTVSSNDIGRGPTLNLPVDMIISENDQLLYVIDDGNNALFEVNIANGNRRVVSNAGTGTGPNFEAPIAIVFNPTSQRILTLDDSNNRKIIIEVNLSNGNRVNLSGVNVGSGDQLSAPRDMVINANSNALFITDAAYNGLRRIDLNNGSRSYYAPADPSGIDIRNSVKLERNRSGDRFYVALNQNVNTLVEINMTNGQRRRVANIQNTFYQGRSITGFSINPDTTKLHYVGRLTRNLTEIDINNGTMRALYPINQQQDYFFEPRSSSDR